MLCLSLIAHDPQDVEAVQSIFEQVGPTGEMFLSITHQLLIFCYVKVGTPTGRRLQEILENEMSQLDAALQGGPSEYGQRLPLDLIVITDGAAGVYFPLI